MAQIAVVEVAAGQIGLQGITVGGSVADRGGSSDPGGVTIPIIRPRMFDDRAVCVEVSQFVHQGQAPDLTGCKAYHDGLCRLGGSGVKCLFHEASDHPTWDRARDFRFIEGQGMVHRGLWDRFGVGGR